MNRAKFLKSILIAGVASQIPFFYSCTEEEIEESNILTNDQLKLIRSVQDILFPAYNETRDDLFSAPLLEIFITIFCSFPW